MHRKYFSKIRQILYMEWNVHESHHAKTGLNHLTAEPFTIFSRNSAYAIIAYSKIQVALSAVVLLLILLELS